MYLEFWAAICCEGSGRMDPGMMGSGGLTGASTSCEGRGHVGLVGELDMEWIGGGDGD